MWGTPGFFLGPVLFTLFTTRLDSLLSNHHLTYYPYADDTRILISFQKE